MVALHNCYMDYMIGMVLGLDGLREGVAEIMDHYQWQRPPITSASALAAALRPHIQCNAVIVHVLITDCRQC